MLINIREFQKITYLGHQLYTFLDVCYIEGEFVDTRSLTRNIVSSAGQSSQHHYRMIYDGRLKATRLSSRATRISREYIESTMIARRLFSPADFYTFNDILKMTGRSRSWTFNFLRRNGITHTCHSGIRHYDKILFDKV